jgi:hypothetical protein
VKEIDVKDIIGVRRAALVAVCLLAVVACVPQPTDPGDIVITNNTTNTNNNGQGANPAASPSPGSCGPVTEVTNGLLGTGGVKNATLRLGPPAQSVPLDTTPNRNVDEQCNSFRRVAWSVTQGTVVCRLDNPESYTPTVTAAGLGTCVIRASISGVSASEPITINVVP